MHVLPSLRTALVHKDQMMVSSEKFTLLPQYFSPLWLPKHYVHFRCYQPQYTMPIRCLLHSTQPVTLQHFE